MNYTRILRAFDQKLYDLLQPYAVKDESLMPEEYRAVVLAALSGLAVMLGALAACGVIVVVPRWGATCAPEDSTFGTNKPW